MTFQSAPVSDNPALHKIMSKGKLTVRARKYYGGNVKDFNLINFGDGVYGIRQIPFDDQGKSNVPVSIYADNVEKAITKLNQIASNATTEYV